MVLFCDEYLPQKCQDFKKEIIKKITDIEEDCSACDKQETSATENGMETHEKLFTTKSELNIINKRLHNGKKERNRCKSQTQQDISL